MKEIRIHGRGGQGAVLAAELLVVAAFEDNKYGQAFPAFGGERRGAAVQAFIRLDDASHPTSLSCHHPGLGSSSWTRPCWRWWTCCRDCSRMAWCWSTARRAPPAWDGHRIPGFAAFPATRIALEVMGQPLVNSAMLGAFSAATGAVSLAAVQKAFRHRFPGAAGEKNCRGSPDGL